jgi:hypothetical protein
MRVEACFIGPPEEVVLTFRIHDKAEEFRIEILGHFGAEAVEEAETAWKAALEDQASRHICMDITQMTSYDRAGYLLLRDVHAHGTHIVAGTPASLRFFADISGPLRPFSALPPRRPAAKPVVTIPTRTAAAGE